jgi:subtilisin family serine protease
MKTSAAATGRSCVIDGAGRRSRGRAVVRAAALALVLLAVVGVAVGFAAPPARVPDELLVRFRDGSDPAARGALHAASGATVVRHFASVPGLHLVKLGAGASMDRALAQYGYSPDVLYVEPNHALKLEAMPNDPRFVAGDPGVWGLNMVPLFSDTDIDAPEAWDLVTGSANVVVAIVDTGIDYTHEDLAANVFRNEADCNTNGIDDDGNGFVDDCHGIAPVNGHSDPMDDHGHGSHVAGTIGAVGNNGIGVVGVNWDVRLMACKMFDAAGDGTLAAAITCLDYIARMKDRGVNIVASNNSWSDNQFSAALLDAIDAHRQRGILFVAAAGNFSPVGCAIDPFNCRTDNDNDRKPTWPASFYLPNIIGVANHVDWGHLNATSGYGRRTVHLSAPGTFILSTTPGNTYDYYSGTSMATPHVAGVAALLKAQSPARDWKAIKNLILAGTEGDMYPDDDHVITRMPLNARNAVACQNRTVLSRLRPIRASMHAVVGQPMELAALHIRCAVPNGTVTVTVSPGGQTLTLRDDGAGFDQEAGDGIYTAQWTPAAQGMFSLTFPGADVVTVQVLASAYSVAEVPFVDRVITGTPLQFLPGEPALIESPFPLRFAGGSFSTLVVDDRGAVHFNGGGYNADLAIYNEPLPTPYHSTLIAPFWDQLYEGYPGLSEVVWEVTGTAPNRELVVEWRNMQRSDRFCVLFEGFVSFQVVFFEGSSDVLFNYRDVTFGGECPDLDRGGSATVGIQVAPDVATPYSFNTPTLADGSALLWTLGQAPQPVIAVTPASRDFGTVPVGATADLTFTVQNTGTGTLTGEAKTALPFSIVSGAAYALGAGQSQTVTVRFSPTTAAPSVGDVTFTGGDNPSRPVHGVGAAANVAPDLPTALGQFRTDSTAVAVGAWTNQTSVVLKFSMRDASPADSLTPEVEVKPLGTAFTGAGLVAGPPVASSGAPVQGSVSLAGLLNGVQYHWRARTRDAAGLTSAWVSFGGNLESARDLGVDTALPAGSIVIAAGKTWTTTRAVSLALKCTDTRSGCTLMQLAQDGGAFAPPVPFTTTATWSLSGPDGKKTLAVRFLDGAGNLSRAYTDTITLDTTAPTVTAVTATPNPFALGQYTTIRFRAADALSASCRAEARILDAGGRLVRTLVKTVLCPAAGALASVAWDGRNAARALVPPGTYTIDVTATDLAGNTSAVARGTVIAQ